MEISNRLVEKGHDVTIYHSNGSPCDWMVGLAKTKPDQEVLSEEHDVLIYNDPVRRDFFLAKEAKAKLKVFLILGLYKKELLNGFHPSIFLPWNRRTRFVKKSLSMDYLILCNATWEKNWLKDHIGIDSELSIGGINTEVFYPIQDPMKRKKKTVLYSGDARARKGTATIEKSIKRVIMQIPDLEVMTYHGKGIPQNEMAKVYSAADVFVEASRHAGWNNPVVEAMACKTPVVCTDIGGVQDFAIHEETALLVPVGDDKAMAASILRLISEPELACSLIQRAYNRVTGFRWDDSIDRMERILEYNLKKIAYDSSSVT